MPLENLRVRAHSSESCFLPYHRATVLIARHYTHNFKQLGEPRRLLFNKIQVAGECLGQREQTGRSNNANGKPNDNRRIDNSVGRPQRQKHRNVRPEIVVVVVRLG